MGTSSLAAVSFYRVPLVDIGRLANEIVALGWEPLEERGEPWVALFRKSFPEGTADPEAELRDVMGDYWMDAAAVATTLATRSSASTHTPTGSAPTP